MRISDWSSDVCSSDLLLRETVEQREAVLTGRQKARRNALEAANALATIRKEHGALTGSISAAHDALEVIKRQKSAADAIIEVGKDIARKTREARGRVVRRVFNDELHSVWRDLFRSEEHTSELQSLM